MKSEPSGRVLVHAECDQKPRSQRGEEREREEGEERGLWWLFVWELVAWGEFSRFHSRLVLSGEALDFMVKKVDACLSM